MNKGGESFVRVRGLFAVTFVALVACVQALAATVEISVVERGGEPVPDQIVALFAVTPDIQIDPLFFMNTRPAGRCTTGPSGQCQIAGLSVGVYFPFLFPIADPNLVAPIGPPLSAYGTVTVSKPDAVASVRIALQRGVRVLFQVVSTKAAIPQRSRVELANDGGEKATAVFDAGGKAQITLGSGRWLAHLAGPAGARIVMVELDDAELTTPDVPLDLVAPSSDRFVTWTLSAPCRVSGKVTSNLARPGVAIEATLVRPGTWSDSALCRARNCAPPATVSLSPIGEYAFELPSGTWRIAPFGESLLECRPPLIDASCEDGEDRRADFDVLEKEADGAKAVLVVRVLGEGDRPVSDVPVEVWPSTGNLEADRPIAMETTGRSFAPAMFTRLPAGSYLLRARSPGYRMAVSELPAFDPEARAPRMVTIRLDRGATIDALAMDEKGQPVRGVGLDLKRIDAPRAGDDPVSRLAEPDEAISVPPSEDQTGHVVVSGLVAGTYDVTPVLSGAAASTAAIGIGAGEETPQPSVVVSLNDQERKELSVRVRKAASLAGRLMCADGGLLPSQADVCVVGLPRDGEDEAYREACLKPVLPLAPITLSGDRRDAFLVGPLTPGSFRLGLRPRGYTNWTWVFGTPDGAQAALVQVDGNDAVELGTIPVLCGPAVAIRPTVLSGDPLPDLTSAVVVAELTRKTRKGAVERLKAPAERDRDRIVLRELPPGEWTLDVTMSHPFFVPAIPLHLSIPVELERGMQIRADVEVAFVGGAIVIEAPSGSARLTGPDGVMRVTEAKDGTIAIDGVAPGSYRVELCEDAACARVVRRWDEVRVVRGEKAVLAEANDPATTSPPPDTSASSLAP